MQELFSDTEIERYARHIVLREVGGAGQALLKQASVAVVGAGGLGSPCLIYLAAAGVGQLTIIDNDAVELSNLQRQVIHATENVGRPKTDSAASSLVALNPHVSVSTHAERLTEANAPRLLEGASIVVDATDNFNSRAALAEACESLSVPLVSGAVSIWDGSVTVIAPHLNSPLGKAHPRFKDLFPRAPEAQDLTTCTQVGIMGALAGMIGTIQAMEVIKLITGAGDPLLGKVLLVDARTMRFEVLEY